MSDTPNDRPASDNPGSEETEPVMMVGPAIPRGEAEALIGTAGLPPEDDDDA